MSVIRDSDGVKYKFPDRSCQQCCFYPCFQGVENCVCDMAKYGCKTFKEKCDNNIS